MKHKEFILTHLTDLIEQTLRPMDLYKGQVCNYIMKEYVLQTLFMKLTGCMEQKRSVFYGTLLPMTLSIAENFCVKIPNKENTLHTRVRNLSMGLL